MAGEKTYPILPCRALNDVAPFHAALGFETAYRQERPNPYLVVRRGDLHLHFSAIEGFDPAQSYGSVIVVVPDADALHQAFAAGLRAAFGKVPVAGIRHAGAPPVERLPALVYRAELATRMGDGERAHMALDEARGLELTEDERSQLAGELVAMEELSA